RGSLSSPQAVKAAAACRRHGPNRKAAASRYPLQLAHDNGCPHFRNLEAVLVGDVRFLHDKRFLAAFLLQDIGDARRKCQPVARVHGRKVAKPLATVKHPADIDTHLGYPLERIGYLEVEAEHER